MYTDFWWVLKARESLRLALARAKPSVEELELAIERACEAHLPECELKAASESLQKALLRTALDAARFLDASQSGKI